MQLAYAAFSEATETILLFWKLKKFVINSDILNFFPIAFQCLLLSEHLLSM